MKKSPPPVEVHLEEMVKAKCNQILLARLHSGSMALGVKDLTRTGYLFHFSELSPNGLIQKINLIRRDYCLLHQTHVYLTGVNHTSQKLYEIHECIERVIERYFNPNRIKVNWLDQDSAMFYLNPNKPFKLVI